MTNKCVCGRLFAGTECENCGRVYTYVEDTEQTKGNIKKYIIKNTSVTRHSSWGDYYDFPIAPKETIDEFIKDMNRHKTCVEQYIERFDNEYLIEVRDQLGENRYIADSILDHIGYTYEEITCL